MCSFNIYDINFFFFKQKTAYEMRISDWSSDVCSSDLEASKSQKSESGSKKSVSHRQQGSFLNVGPSVETIRQILNLIDCLQYQDAESQAQRLTVKFPGHPFGWQAFGIDLYSSGLVEEEFSLLLQIGIASCRARVCHYV